MRTLLAPRWCCYRLDSDVGPRPVGDKLALLRLPKSQNEISAYDLNLVPFLPSTIAQDAVCYACEQTFEVDSTEEFSLLRPGFQQNSLPRNPDVEQIAKVQLEASLRDASRDTQKGEYHKADHAWKLLGLIDTRVVPKLCTD